ncbi:DUF5020 family protein [Thiomicrorhabdus sp.]|uniref:DUF5020 family protein n=1 Tax=Thiomicrorhabdus sp. TaxID=2039724 RepID=UPI002AA7CF88|nr:DUF5020 family protein [Thiomicrorhabdus sp.]
MSISTTFKKKSLLSGIALAGAMLMSPMSQAADWSNTNLLLLNGSGYKQVPSNNEVDGTVVTVEHVSGWKYGSNFFFFDVTNANTSKSDFYGEISPSLSFGKMTGKDLSFGFVKDVSLTGTLEIGQVTNAQLYGIGFDLDIPGVPVAKVNFYQRASTSEFYPGKMGSGQQVTFVWMAPFNLGSTSWTFEGFLDYATAEKEVGKVENIIASPRLTMDIGALFGSPKKISAGIEYAYWMNKYGTKGIDEGVPQATVKWTF